MVKMGTVHLLANMERLTGPSHAVDERLFELYHGRKRQISTFEQYDPSEKLPAYTSSLDAALALAEKLMLPKLSDLIHTAWSEVSKAEAWHIHVPKPEDGPVGPKLALALCLATVRALVAEETRANGR